MIKKLQMWLGAKAPVDIPEFVYMIIGVRHTRFRMDYEGTSGEIKRFECDKVHRSFWDRVACSQKDTRADYKAFVERYRPESAARDLRDLDLSTLRSNAKIEAFRW